MKSPLPKGIAFGLVSAIGTLVMANTPAMDKSSSGEIATAARTNSAPAQTESISAVPPFVGTKSETWEQFGAGAIPNGTSILGGIATISGENHMETRFWFHMCSVVGRPSDGSLLMDQDRPYDSVTITFSQTISAFGAYWGSGIDCSIGDAQTILTFKDVSGNNVGSDSFFYTGGGDLEWHGYAFSTPVKTIVRTASDTVEGFAMDGLQATVASGLKITTVGHPSPNTIHLNCVGVPNVINRIEWSPDLSPGSFHTLVSVMANASGVFQYDDTNAGTKKFYRVAYP